MRIPSRKQRIRFCPFQRVGILSRRRVRVMSRLFRGEVRRLVGWNRRGRWIWGARGIEGGHGVGGCGLSGEGNVLCFSHHLPLKGELEVGFAVVDRGRDSLGWYYLAVEVSVYERARSCAAD